jgi:hypothetical protein
VADIRNAEAPGQPQRLLWVEGIYTGGRDSGGFKVRQMRIPLGSRVGSRVKRQTFTYPDFMRSAALTVSSMNPGEIYVLYVAVVHGGRTCCVITPLKSAFNQEWVFLKPVRPWVSRARATRSTAINFQDIMFSRPVIVDSTFLIIK